MIPQQLNIFTGKHPADNIKDRCDSKKWKPEERKALRITDLLFDMNNKFSTLAECVS